MSTAQEYLTKRYSEKTPRWLVCGEYSLEQFFNSRTIFYPGAYKDGDAVKFFNSSRMAHCFVYADFSYDHETLDCLQNEELLGYRLERVIELRPEDFAYGLGTEEEQREDRLPITPEEAERRHLGYELGYEYANELLTQKQQCRIVGLGRQGKSLEEIVSRICPLRTADGSFYEGDRKSREIVRMVLIMKGEELAKRYCPPLLGRMHDLPLNVDPTSGKSFDLIARLAIYQRRSEYDRTHGGFRIAVLFVRAEANALYPKLYGRSYSYQRPFAVLLADHMSTHFPLRFCNPDGPMATFAYYIGGLPEFLLVNGCGDELWFGYDKKEQGASSGGRKLYQRWERGCVTL